MTNVEAVSRAAVIGDKHQEAIRRLLSEKHTLPANLVAALETSGAAAGNLKELAELIERRST